MERRLAAILAADVVGYSRLMGANETGTLTSLDTLQTDFVNPKISEYQGRIVKQAGDGMLVEFPSVVNAVACATELQRGMRNRNSGVPQDRRIEFRMGVNVGDVIVQGEDGDIEQAIDLLERLLPHAGHELKHGWINYDSDLDPLRNHPRFQKILELIAEG
jgi:adenylate cyclase